MGSIKKHPDFKNYVHQSQVQEVGHKLVIKAIKEGKIPPSGSIKDHPQYNALLKKYAMRDDSTCPPTYIPCQPPSKLKKVAITSHPDIGNYILKSQVKKRLENALSSETRLVKAKKVIRAQKKIINTLRTVPIESHPQYNNLMARYAVRDNTTCPPSYRPCENVHSINKHPEIHKYILKTQIPNLMDNKCRVNFKRK